MKKKGFTLIELVVVMAIIGILSTLLVPNMVMWVRKSKLSTANGEAKIIYNAAQTIVQKYETIDRSISDDSNKRLFGTHTCGNISGVSFTDTKGSDLYDKIASYYNKADRCKWAVKIENYKVVAVYYSESDDNGYVGRYPNPYDFDSPEGYDKNLKIKDRFTP